MKKILPALLVSALSLGAPSDADAKKIHTIGDSTMANYDESATVTRGWCQYLQQFLEGIEVNNRGKSGASSKSFYKEAAYWTSVKKQMEPGDYVLIQFAHNDEKTQGMDGDELKAYYTSIGDTDKASATDYRGTNPSTTYKEYLRKYINETREAGCTPILAGAICRMYFTNGTIRRNGRHDLGDSFSKLTASGVLEKQSVASDDHSMDYVYQMQEVAKELDVPFVDLTTGTADLYISYGDKACHDILGDGDGSTHLSATGAALIARRFVGLCQEQGLLTEYARLTGDLGVTPSDGNLGQGYKGQSLTREFMITGFDLTPSAGNVTVTATDGITLSTDGKEWTSSLSLPYEGGTLIQRFNVRATLDGDINGTVSILAGDKKTDIPVSATAVNLAGGTEASVYWRLEKDDSYVVTGPVNAIAQNYSGMELQRYANPNANTVWPSDTGFESSRKTQRNLIKGGNWPAGEIDEVSTRYIEFGVTATEGTVYNVDEISYYVCGCGGNGMCLKVYYSIDDDFANPVNIFEMKSMPANNMQDGKIRPVIRLEGGQSLRLRFYPWYNGAASGKTLCLSDIKFHGYVSSDDQSAITDITASAEPVSTDYYTLQGIRVTNPATGSLYIVRSTYSDGSTRVSKQTF